MAGFNFEALNNNFVFELPEGLWDSANFVKPVDALVEYEDKSLKTKSGLRTSRVIPVIAYGITKIDREKHPDAVSERSAWVATEEEIINVPGFQLPVIENILKDEAAIEGCQNGLMGVRLREYDCQYGRRVRVEFCNR